MNYGIIGSRVARGAKEEAKVRSIVEYFILRCTTDKDVIVSGGCPLGADFWARSKAEQYGRRYVECPPGNRRGPVKADYLFRNQTIVLVSDMILAVYDGKSGGTMYTIKAAMDQCKPVWVVEF